MTKNVNMFAKNGKYICNKYSNIQNVISNIVNMHKGRNQ